MFKNGYFLGIKILRLQNAKQFTIWRFYVKKMMKIAVVLLAPSQAPPNPGISSAMAVNKLKKDD